MSIASEAKRLKRDLRPVPCPYCGQVVQLVHTAVKVVRPGHITEAEWDAHPAGGNWQRSRGREVQRTARTFFDADGPHRCLGREQEESPFLRLLRLRSREAVTEAVTRDQ
jgi:hypothetical protein